MEWRVRPEPRDEQPHHRDHTTWHNYIVGVPYSDPASMSKSDSQYDFGVIDTSYTFPRPT